MKRLRDSHQDCVYADASSRECFVTTAEDFALACRQCAPRRPAPSTLVELCGLRYSTVLLSRAPQCGVIFVGPVNILRGCYTNQPVVARHSTWLLCVGRAMHQLLVRMMRLLPPRGKFTFGAVTRRLGYDTAHGRRFDVSICREPRLITVACLCNLPTTASLIERKKKC